MCSDRPPLAAVAEARNILEGIEVGELSDDSVSRLMNAIEELENVILNASPEDFEPGGE